MKVLIISIISCSLAVCIRADCYRQNQCVSRGKNPIKYRAEQTWIPREDPCYNCECYEVKRYVRGCQEVVTSEPTTRVAAKSAIFEKLYNLPDQTQDEEVKISKDEADTIVCKPLPGFVFNWETWTFEYPVLKNVYFYYTELHSQCCSRFISVSTSDPSCKVVRGSRCSTKLVRKDDPTKPCDAPQFYRG